MTKLVCLFLFLLALGGQQWFTQNFSVPIEGEPDGAMYLAVAHNVLVHGVYSADSEPDLTPTYMRLPGYPLLVTGVFALFGDGNEWAVRCVQAVLATLTAACVAALAFLWEPAPERRTCAALVAFLLAAACPFTAIYPGIILTETLTFFLVMLSMLVATWAFRASSPVESLWRWLVAGALVGAAQLVRPESGLFAAAIGFTLVGCGALETRLAAGDAPPGRWRRVIVSGAVFSLGFALMLVPWTVRNARVFGVFAPLPPVNLAMPGERSYQGFCAWYRTWADSERYLEPFYWDMTDEEPSAADVDDLPSTAFDTPDERARTTALFEQYNVPVTPDNPDSPRLGITPAMDDAFGQLARERAARSWWRYHVRLPLHRAIGLWFVPHAQYFSFEGSLFPLSQMKPEFQYHLWLPIFFGLSCVYTVLGLAGMWRLVRTRGPARNDAWRWAILVALVVLPRWIYLSTLENTEPRYMAEIFPFLSVLGGIALARFWPTVQRTTSAVA